MNVNVEELAPCKKLLRVDVEAQAVDQTFEQVTADFQKEAHLPGFRAGKAPRAMVESRYKQEIEKEVKRKLISESYKKAVEQKNLRVLISPEIEEIQFGRGQALQFAATIETAPSFELPNYKGLLVRRPAASVTEEDMDRALKVLQAQRPFYKEVSRPIQKGDFAVVDYAGTVDGVPIETVAPNARRLSAEKNFWIEIADKSFLPAFPEQLIGASAGEERTVRVDFPSDFLVKELSGRQGSYAVRIKEVRERFVPELSDEFAQSYGAASLEKLREGVRADLQNELELKQNRDVRTQLVRMLVERVNFELPESIVLSETRNLIYDIVRENQERGVTTEAIDQQKEEIYNFASSSAKERVKANFILQRIAENERIEARPEEIYERVVALAARNKMSPQKLLTQLRDRGALPGVALEIVTKKVLDFLQLHARIEEVPGEPIRPGLKSGE